MIKAVLVDDEQIILDSLKNNYNWTDMGIKIAGTALDGDIAFDLICEIEPDLIITDIRMPTLNGIEMIKLLHTANIFPFFIFATGYSDFEFTKEAIKLGASDYILKPFSKTELEETIRRCVKEIKEAKEKMYDMDHNVCELKLKHYFSTASSKKNPRRIIQLNSFLEEHLHLNEWQMNLMTMDLSPENTATLITFEDCIHLIKRLNFKLGWYQCLAFHIEESDIVVVINYRTVKNRDRIDLNAANLKHMKLITASLFENLGIDVVVTSQSKPSAKGAPSVESIYDCYHELKNRIPAVAKADNPVFNPHQAQKYIQDAIAYIGENYGSQIKLKDVAESVYLSESHFSTLFSKSVGTSFSKYIAKFRVEKAKEYMKKNPYAKIYEVSQAVGYTDARYFSTLFRKLEGMTPSEYITMLFTK